MNADKSYNAFNETKRLITMSPLQFLNYFKLRESFLAKEVFVEPSRD